MAEKLNKKEDKKEEVTLDERIGVLKNQQEQVRETWVKIAGAIELLEAMKKEGEQCYAHTAPLIRLTKEGVG